MALYARVSTTDKGQDVALQLIELQNYATQRGWSATAYVDQGISGAMSRRPALDDLLAAARRRKIDVVVVWRLDRLGRSLSHLLHILNEFETVGVAFVSLKEAIDMTTATGRLMAQLLGAFAEFEREIIRERVRAGIENARRKGVKIGRKGISTAEKERVLEAFLANPEFSVRALARETGVSASSVHRIIRTQKN